MTVIDPATGEITPLPRSFGQIAKALAAFQAEAPTVAKGKKAVVPTKAGGQYSYQYADLADIQKAALPLLATQGLAFICTPGHGMLTGWLIHESGEYMNGELPIGGDTPQQLGSSITYARRYLFGCLTGVVTDDDDDGQAAAQAKPRNGQQQRQNGRQQPTSSYRTPPEPDPEIERQQAEIRQLNEQRQALRDREPQTSADRTRASVTQQGMIAAQFSRLGVTDRESRLAMTAHFTGRDSLGSSKELSVPEAVRVLKVLEKLRDRDALDQALTTDPLTGDDQQ